MDQREEKIQWWTLNAASLLGQMTISMVNLALVYHLRYTLGASGTVVGLAASTYTGMYFVCCLLFGGFLQRFRPKDVVCASLLGMGVAIALAAMSDSIPVVFLCLALYGFFMSGLWPQVEAWITRGAEGEKLNRLTSAFNFSWSFGTGLSSYLAAALVTISPAFGLLAGSCLFGLVFLLVGIVANVVPGIRAIGPERDHIKEVGEGEDHSTPLRYDSWIAVFVVYSALSVVLNIFPMHAAEGAGFTGTQSGVLLLLRGMATCFAFVHFGRTKYWQFKRWAIWLAEIFFAAITLLFSNIGGLVGTAVYLVLFGLVFSLCYSFSIFHGAAGAVDRGRRMAIHECVLTLGQIVGASVGGTVYDRLGWSNVLLLLSAMGFAAVALQMLFAFVSKRRAGA